MSERNSINLNLFINIIMADLHLESKSFAHLLLLYFAIAGIQQFLIWILLIFIEIFIYEENE